MGQNISRSSEPWTIGYTTSTPSVDTNDPDLVLLRPEQYGLGQRCMLDMSPDDTMTKASEPSSSTTCTPGTFERTDSGYCSSTGEMTLSPSVVKDLGYVDATHYDGPRSVACSMATDSCQDDHGNDDDTEIADDAAEKDRVGRVTLAQSGGVAAHLWPTKVRDLRLSQRSLQSLHTNIGYLTQLRKLDLSYNELTCLPDAIGCLQHLQVLLVQHNALATLPESIGGLARLKELDASFNRLEDVYQLRRLTHLRTLDLSHNPIRMLQAEVVQLPRMRRLALGQCPLQLDMTYTLDHQPPSLKECCARVIVRNHQRSYPIDQLPRHLAAYLQTSHQCIACQQPYFESFVTRHRLIEKSDQLLVPTEYRLCSAHWSDDDDRILSMFSTPSRPLCQTTKNYSLGELWAMDGINDDDEEDVSLDTNDHAEDDQGLVKPRDRLSRTRSLGRWPTIVRFDKVVSRRPSRLIRS